jgi:hypothetical protein
MVAPYAFWADHATTCKSTGHSPFYMVHSVEPVLPFDITLATFLVPNLTDKLSTVDLIATRTRQLLKRDNNLAAIHSNILKSCFESVYQFKHQFKSSTPSMTTTSALEHLCLSRIQVWKTTLGTKSSCTTQGRWLSCTARKTAHTAWQS